MLVVDEAGQLGLVDTFAATMSSVVKSRRRVRAVVGAAMAAAVLVGCGSAGTGSETTSPPSGEFWRSADVVDGDTLYLSGPRGEVEVRLIGVNTPETDECFYDEASAALSSLVDGEDLVLVTDRSDVDQGEAGQLAGFLRFLASVPRFRADSEVPLCAS